jgi:beta-galactosidase
MVLRDRNHPSVIFWGIGNEIPEAWTKEGAPLAAQLAARVRSLDSTRPVTEAFPGATYTANTDAVMVLLDVSGYNYNLKQNHDRDHDRVPKRIMMTTESVPTAAFDNWKLAHDNPYILGEFVWTAMDYLGESGIGAWSYETPERAAQAAQVSPMIEQTMANMGADGKNPFEAFNKPPDGNPNPAADMMKFMFPGFPWHASDCGDIDLTGYRKPESYYRDILWNGGDRVYATVRLPEPKGQKIVAIGWSVYPTLPSWTWPGHEGQNLQIEVYASTQKVRLYLNDKLIGEMSTTPAQQRKALFTVPYAPGSLKAVGVNDGQEVATTILHTVGNPVRLQLTADRKVLRADGQDLSFITVEAVDADSRLQINATQPIKFSLSGPGTIIAVGNGDGTSRGSYQGDQTSLFGGRALVVVRSAATQGTLQLKASTPGLDGADMNLQVEPSTDGALPVL